MQQSLNEIIMLFFFLKRAADYYHFLKIELFQIYKGQRGIQTSSLLQRRHDFFVP